MVTISRAWRFSNEPQRIHYIIESQGESRHLFTIEGESLYTFLSSHLLGTPDIHDSVVEYAGDI